MTYKSSIWFVFDIDGVLTSGSIITDGMGNIQKSLNMKDIDAIYELSRMGCHIIAITSEKDQITEWVSKRFPWDDFYDGVNDKRKQLSCVIEKYEIDKDNLFYVGDGKKDLEAFELAGTTICPADAIEDIRNKADYCLKGYAGSGALWEVIAIASARKSQMYNNEIQDKKGEATDIWLQNLNEHKRIIALMNHDDIMNQITKSAEIICNAIKNGKKIVLFGNGGSAADAQHIAAEFVGRYKANHEAWNAVALTTNSSIITAVANDFDYSFVFSRQVAAIVNKGDIIIGISTSSQSKNVINGIREACKCGAFTIMLTGGNANVCIADLTVCVPSLKTSNIQEMHILIGHFWADFVERNMV